MLQRFASALFGGTVEELSRHGRPEGEKGPEKEDEDWILVNYLGEARTEDLNCQKMMTVGLELEVKHMRSTNNRGKEETGKGCMVLSSRSWSV